MQGQGGREGLRAPGHRRLTPLALTLLLRPSQDETPLKEAGRPGSPAGSEEPDFGGGDGGNVDFTAPLSDSAGLTTPATPCPPSTRPPPTRPPRPPLPPDARPTPTHRPSATRPPRCPTTRPPCPTVSYQGWRGAVLGAMTTSRRRWRRRRRGGVPPGEAG